MPDDHERIEALEAAVAEAGTPQDAPHHEMAHDVAEQTVKASERNQRLMVSQMQSTLDSTKWFVVLIAVVFFVAYLIAR